MRVLQACKRALSAVLTAVVCAVCVWPVVWLVARSLPLTGPIEVARRHAHDDGWVVPDGEPLKSYYVTGLDLQGGGEVEVIFLLSTNCEPWQTFVVRMRRESFLTDWQIIKSGERDMPIVR